MNARIQDIDVIVEPRLDATTGQFSYAAIVNGRAVGNQLCTTPEAATLAGLNGGAQ